MASQTVLALENVCVIREGKQILGPLSFRISAGERWVILGPNGAGKSTLLGVLAARIFPSKGQAILLEQQVGRVDLSELRTRIGLAAPSLEAMVDSDELVRDFVLTAAYAIFGRWNENYDLWDESRAVALLTTFGVRELGQRRFSTLSSGEKKRVLISRALMADPELLLLDEPAAGLDVGGREDLLKRFAHFSNDASAPASVLVTHHIEEIPIGTTHAILLKDGKIAVSGPVESVITSEHVSAVFGLPIEVLHEGSRFFARA
ncbi:MAG: ABC transporter ATP-binding protein [Candidatus Planktophila sp.]|jgi:iron complex transport system ATP-binding protein